MKRLDYYLSKQILVLSEVAKGKGEGSTKGLIFQELVLKNYPNEE